jgi:hypothetical protein
MTSAIMTSGMVNSSSFPDSPSRRGSVALGLSMIGWSSVADTNIASMIPKMLSASGPVKLRIANVRRR